MDTNSSSLELTEQAERLRTLNENLLNQHREYIRLVKDVATKQKELRSSLEKHSKQRLTLRDNLRRIKKRKDLTGPVSSLARADVLNHDVTTTLPTSTSWPINYMLGGLDVVMPHREIRFKYKLGYEDFKRKSSIFSFLLALFAFILPYLSQSNVAISTYDCCILLFQFFFHISLIFKESILIKNGSKINRYWILHHYSSTILLFLLLICRFDSLYLTIRSHIAIFSMLGSAFHYIRHKRAISKFYADLATERAHFMDLIDSTRELGVEDPSVSYKLPLSVIFIGICAVGIHVYQNFIGIMTILVSWSQRTFDTLFWTGILLTCLGIGNFLTTLFILFSKLKHGQPFRYSPRTRPIPGFPNKKITIPVLHQLYAHVTENEDSDESSTTEIEFKPYRPSDPLNRRSRMSHSPQFNRF
ncbi:hypothetical protein P9112_006593 [Eukaryota sp. TZLM1-RC]